METILALTKLDSLNSEELEKRLKIFWDDLTQFGKEDGNRKYKEDTGELLPPSVLHAATYLGIRVKNDKFRQLA